MTLLARYRLWLRRHSVHKVNPKDEPLATETLVYVPRLGRDAKIKYVEWTGNGSGVDTYCYGVDLINGGPEHIWSSEGIYVIDV